MLNYKASNSVQPLKGVAVKSIISQLGQAAKEINSRFTCGGKYEVPSNKPIKLVYRQDNLLSSEEWHSVEFPGVSEVAMIKLLDACTVASYGHKGKDVVDKAYRNAFALEPDNFLTSFQICATPIVQEIQSIASTVVGLKAELYKMNVYACGGFFKAHVDTPRSERMFGSLVVCLPTHFTGGELMVRHNKQEIKYDWSSDTSSTLHWAAFFSDVEHEVLPVNEGYRVTLTYNLSYHSKTKDSTIDIKSYSFYRLLQAVLSNPVFMRDGGVLGFNSHYSYVFDTQWADLLAPINTIGDKAAIIQRLSENYPCNEFVRLTKDRQARILYRVAGIDDAECNLILDGLSSDSPLLKGADSIVVESARSLGLPVCVKPFLSHDGYIEDCYKYALKDFSQPFMKEEWIDSDDSNIHFLEELQVFGDATCRCKSQDITWCQKLLYHQPAGAALAYGNSPSLELWYKSAAILIKLPKWGNHRQKLIATSIGEHCTINTEPGEDGLVEDFKDVILDYEDIIKQETQQLLNEVEKLLRNGFVNQIKELVHILKKMKVKLNSHAASVDEEVENICTIKCDLYRLRDDIESDVPDDSKVNHLHHIIDMVERNYW